MKQAAGKFLKGFLFGGVSSFIAVLGSVGCDVHSVEDLKALGLSAVAGIFAGGLHAAWNLFFTQSEK